MKKNISKILYKPILATLALAISVLSFNLPTVNAESYTTTMSLNAQAMTLSADVPMTLPIVVDSQGTVTTAPDAVIRNTSPGRIKVENISVTTKNQWELNDFNTDYGKEKVNQKKFGLSFNKDHVRTDGSVFLNPANWPSINPGDSSPLKYNATVSRQTENTNLDVAEVTFVIGWDIADGEPTTPTDPDPVDPDPVDPVDPDPDQGDSGKSQEWIDDNFTFITESWAPSSYGGYFKYIGTDTTVTIPTEINGHILKDTYKMFMETSVDKVINTNPNITNMSWMFADSQATTLDLSSFDTSNVTDMSNMFRLSQATTLDLSDLDTSNVTNMSSMFESSTATTLDLSSFDTSNVTDMYKMFSYSKATTLDLSELDTSSVTNMSNMFYYSQATTLDLSSFNTSNVTNMKWMFQNSEATTGYARTQSDVDRFNTSPGKPAELIFTVREDKDPDQGDSGKSQEWIDDNFTFVPDAYAPNSYGGENGYFKYTGTDTEVTIPTEINGHILKDTYRMFEYTSVKKVINTNPNITNMANMFSGSLAKELDLSSFDTSNVIDMFSMFWESEATTLDLSSFNTSNVTNMSDMFNSSQATTLDLSTFNTSNVTNMYGMFKGSQATTLDVSNFNTSNVTNMTYMFSGSQATTLDLSSFDTSNVTDMGSMFANSQATTLDLSNFNTSNVTDMGSMFANSQATTLDLSNFNTSNVTDMSSMFNSSQATTIDLSDLDTSNVTDMSFMFYKSQATTLDLSSFDTSNVTKMSFMFSGSQATTLDLSSFDTSNVINVKFMHEMFSSSQATTGYARTQSDADKLNASSDKPSGLTFTVK